jgi:FkbM family methyltransferase
VDVGANEGLFTLLAARRVGPEGRVFALEPSSRELSHLRANLELNRLTNVEVAQLALYAHAGETQLTIAQTGHEGHNTVAAEIGNPTVAVAGVERVRLETLDRFVEEQGLERLDLIKIDAEGSEARILEGGLTTLRELQPVVLLEVEAPHLAAHGSSVEGLLELLADAGYEISVFDENGHVKPHEPDAPLSANIVAVPYSSSKSSSSRSA